MPVELTADKVKAVWQSTTLVDQARNMIHSGNFSEGERLLKAAYSQRESALGQDDAGLADILDELGLCLLKANRLEEAVKQFKAALAILEKHFYPGHSGHAPVLEHLGDCYVRQGEYAEAEPLFKRALEIREKTMSGEHRTIFELIWKLSHIYQKLDKFQDAEAVLAKGLKQLDTPLGPIDEFRYQLAVVSASQGKDKEAETAFRQAIEGLEQRRDYGRLVHCLTSFAAFLKKAGQTSEAEKVSKRAHLLGDAFTNGDHDIFPATLLRA